MKARIFCLIGVTAALVGACKSNPTADGSGTPAAVITNFSSFTLAPGDSATFVAQIVDSRLTPLPGTISFSTCNAAVATVSVDPTYHPVPNTSMRAVVHAVSSPITCILASSAGTTPDSVQVGVVPTQVPLVFAATANTGTTLAIASTSLFKFVPASASVTFGGGITPPVLSATTDTIKVLVPFSTAGVLTVAGVNVTYVSGLHLTLPTTASFTATSTDPFPGDNAWNTAPDITSLIPAAAGSSKPFLVAPAASNAANTCPEDRFGFGPSGTCSILKFTLADSTNISFTTDWDANSGSDIDLVICSDSTAANFITAPGANQFKPCVQDGLAGASSSQPETAGGVKYGPGTYWFVIQNFAGTTQHNYYTTITVQ